MKAEYIAFDGKKFETLKECHEYERNISGLKLYNSDFFQLPHFDIDFATYIIIPTELDLKYYKELCEEHLGNNSHCKISHPGTFMWLPIAMSFVELDEAIKIYEKEIESIKEAKEKLK